MIEKIDVSIVYAEAEKSWQQSLQVPKGTSARELIEKSGYLRTVPSLVGMQVEQLDIGVYAQAIELDTILSQGDRVEIYRPLKADPKEVRRKLALLGKTMGKKIKID